MKMLFLASAVALLSSGAAFACPNLSGAFDCAADENDPSFQLTVSQRLVGSTWAYTATVGQPDGSTVSTEVLADGIVRRYKDSNDQESEPQAYSCEGQTALRMDSSYTDPSAGTVTILMKMSLNNQGSFHQVFEGTSSSYGKFQGMKTCSRH